MHQAIALDPAYQAAESLLQQFERFGVDLGLDRIQHLLTRLGSPHHRVPVIHVAGSNGKGSVCACLSAVLTAAGYRVGRYTSPHLVHWCERICIQDQPIAAADLYAALQEVQRAIDPDQPCPTQFEVFTAAAWLYFAQQQVDLAVMEVGLGGRLDATNVCDRPLVSVITSLSLEHWQRLGPTLADIAREKAGILKPHCPAVIGPLPPTAEAVVRDRLESLSCPTVWVEPAQDCGEGWALYTTPAGLDPVPPGQTYRYPLTLPGQHQCSNSAVAIAALQVLQSQGWQISTQHFDQGLQQVRWPARLQWFSWSGCSVLVDGAHNPAGAIALRQYVDQCIAKGDRLQAPIHWVVGLLATKDHADILQPLLRPGDRLWLVEVPGHASADPQHLMEVAHTVCPTLGSCESYADPIEGLLAAIATSQHQQSQSPSVILCGSLYLIGWMFQSTEWATLSTTLDLRQHPIVPVLHEPLKPSSAG